MSIPIDYLSWLPHGMSKISVRGSAPVTRYACSFSWPEADQPFHKCPPWVTEEPQPEHGWLVQPSPVAGKMYAFIMGTSVTLPFEWDSMAIYSYPQDFGILFQKLTLSSHSVPSQYSPIPLTY